MTMRFAESKKTFEFQVNHLLPSIFMCYLQNFFMWTSCCLCIHITEWAHIGYNQRSFWALCWSEWTNSCCEQLLPQLTPSADAQSFGSYHDKNDIELAFAFSFFLLLKLLFNIISSFFLKESVSFSFTSLTNFFLAGNNHFCFPWSEKPTRLDTISILNPWCIMNASEADDFATARP